MPTGVDDTARRADRRRRLREWADRVFSDRLMIELALLLVPATVLPILFFFPRVLAIFDILSHVIIVAFVLEYGIKLIAAESRWRFFRSPWHVLDLLIVVLAGVDALPWVSWPGGKASPLLRLLRAARIFAVTGRTLRRAVPPPAAPAETAVAPAASVRILEEQSRRYDVAWDAADAAVRDPRETWIDIQRVGPADLDRLTAMFRVPKHLLQSKLAAEAFPGIDYFKDFSVLTLWDMPVDEPSEPGSMRAVSRGGIAVICARDFIATMSAGRNGLFEELAAQDLPLEGESFSVRVLFAVMQRQIGQYKALIQAMEQAVARLEDQPLRAHQAVFLENTFLLKKTIQQQDYNLRHFAQVMQQLSTRKVTLAGIREESLDSYSLLRDEAGALSDTIRIVREDLLSLIELQLNRVSFDLNRVMRLLAVLSCLGLIPAVIGGLLGENLVDQPYPVTLGEVFLLVLALMLLGLYAFHRRGWLK